MRAAVLAKALADHGLETLLISGGMPHDALPLGRARLVQLPPLMAKDTAYSILVDELGKPITPDFESGRCATLLATLTDFEPHLVLTEHFPFGRGKLSFELKPLLATLTKMTPRPLLFASVRDIIEPPESTSKRDRFVDIANRHFDAILIHGDERFARFNLSFPAAAQLKTKLYYTGYIAPPDPVGPQKRDAKILVSAGHGRTAEKLVRTAIAAQKVNNLRMDWEVRLGAGFATEHLASIQSDAGAGLTLRAATPNFAEDLAQADLSVSQAGYNTIVDIARAKIRSVLVPYSGHQEKEQGLRAQQMARYSASIVIDEEGLSPETLLTGMTKALNQPHPSAVPFATNGAERAAQIITTAIAAATPSISRPV